VDWRHFRLGRGEVETLIGSVIFTGQILWLERPLFGRNRVSHFTLVMFLTMTLIALPVSLVTMRQPADWGRAYSSPPVLALIAALVVFCTMIAFVLMNRWQPILPAPEAGLIYAAEPVFASLFALFLPAWLSRLGPIHYSNEKVTLALFVGGGLITLANVLIQLGAARAPVKGSAALSRSPDHPVSAQ
jgi:drug/metabolite transporter (DMT)-like permease